MDNRFLKIISLSLGLILNIDNCFAPAESKFEEGISHVLDQLIEVDGYQAVALTTKHGHIDGKGKGQWSYNCKLMSIKDFNALFDDKDTKHMPTKTTLYLFSRSVRHKLTSGKKPYEGPEVEVFSGVFNEPASADVTECCTSALKKHVLEQQQAAYQQAIDSQKATSQAELDEKKTQAIDEAKAAKQKDLYDALKILEAERAKVQAEIEQAEQEAHRVKEDGQKKLKEIQKSMGEAKDLELEKLKRKFDSEKDLQQDILQAKERDKKEKEAKFASLKASEAKVKAEKDALLTGKADKVKAAAEAETKRIQDEQEAAVAVQNTQLTDQRLALDSKKLELEALKTKKAEAEKLVNQTKKEIDETNKAAAAEAARLAQTIERCNETATNIQNKLDTAKAVSDARLASAAQALEDAKASGDQQAIDAADQALNKAKHESEKQLSDIQKEADAIAQEQERLKAEQAKKLDEAAADKKALEEKLKTAQADAEKAEKALQNPSFLKAWGKTIGFSTATALSLAFGGMLLRRYRDNRMGKPSATAGKDKKANTVVATDSKKRG